MIFFVIDAIDAIDAADCKAADCKAADCTAADSTTDYRLTKILPVVATSLCLTPVRFAQLLCNQLPYLAPLFWSDFVGLQPRLLPRHCAYRLTQHSTYVDIVHSPLISTAKTKVQDKAACVNFVDNAKTKHLVATTFPY